jgi:hypothetical protein
VNRRTFFKAFAAAPAIGLLPPADAAADLPKAKELLTLIGEVTEPGRKNVYRRPDGSLTHW